MRVHLTVLAVAAVVACLAPHQPCAAAAKQPNIILFLQDDQDFALGGWEPLHKTKALVADRGAFATNWFIHTPVCCPSRGELLSGRYFHNIRVPNPTDKACMHIDTDKVNPVSFGAKLGAAGYTLSWFGKHLNSFPFQPPPGWDCPTCRWFVNGGGRDHEPGGFLNASFANFYANEPVKDSYTSAKGLYTARTTGEYAGYTTSIIANKSIEWIRKVAPLGKPWFTAVASKASHFPATPAEWYAEGTFVDPLTAPRTPDWNMTAAQRADHHALIAKQPMISADQGVAIDNHFRNRWRTLLSVDDAVAGLLAVAAEVGQADNTYIFITSDHGYNLGQKNVVTCKLQAYDHSLRIPMWMAGPGIPHGVTFDHPASNVDVAPTFLDLAGVTSDEPLDGQSVAPLLIDFDAPALPEATRAFLKAKYGGAGSHPAAKAASTWPSFHLAEFNALGNILSCNKACSGADLSWPFYPSLQGMACGGWGGRGKPETPHPNDSLESNTFRLLRFVNSSVYGDLQYAEFTQVTNWNYTSTDPAAIFVEVFDLAKDPHQMTNLAATTPKATLAALHNLLVKMFACRGDSCHLTDADAQAAADAAAV